MAIDVKNTSLSTKLGSSSKKTVSSDLIWEDVEDGKYEAELVIVYPWKEVTHDSNVRVRDEEGKYVKDGDDNYVVEKVEGLSWFLTDAVFKIIGGSYDGYAVKGKLSTHPDMIGSAKRFLYNANLFDVELKDLYKNTGAKVNIIVKHKTETYKDKRTGKDKTQDNAYVSYYEKYTVEARD